ncbi:MAG: glycosyl hydrolase [Bacteroidota bacterium]
MELRMYLYRTVLRTAGVLAVLFLVLPSAGSAQRGGKKKAASAERTFSPGKMLGGMQWRCIGPFRGGRSAAVTGVPNQPNLYYMGVTGGGVWRTKDGGQTWENISDGFFGGSIGSVAVSDSDPNVIFVGGGEVTVRGNVSSGDGIWKSTDAGTSWRHVGLPESRHVPRICIHPSNPDIVYAAVLGDLFKSSEERGVYRSQDGGATWEKVLYVNPDAGAVDLRLDPNNPRIVYASTWRVRRTPYSLSSGGEGSGLWKSTDSGKNWENISARPGLPGGPLGIIGVAVSPVNSERVFAMIEAKGGGLFRSDNAGKSWSRVNADRSLRQRAWYYTRVIADTQDEDKVYVMNVSYQVSKDGGRSFKSRRAPHGDHHDLWIAPEDPQRMIIGDDGGAQISFDGGENWSTYENQPTAQFYRVTTDDHFPYRIYGAQQDNSAIRIHHRSRGRYITERDWESTAGGESAHLAPKPDNNEIVVGGSYGGYLTWVNHTTQEERAINVWPNNPMGHGAEDMKYRFQWNFPVFFSPHNPNKLYVASNHLHRSTDMGQSWETISPDLTRNDSAKLGSSGGPITQDNTSVEYYCTVFAAAESALEPGLIWAGSDDGLVHLTRNGKDWENVTPENMPEWGMVNSLEIDPRRNGSVYLAVTRYKMGDDTPYIFHTVDYGKSWKLITEGIAPDHFVRVVRADPERAGLLYAGTERGLYVSLNDGAQWHPFQLNLPIVPITDLAVKDDDLIAATQGRSFWLLDDLGPLRQTNQDIAMQSAHLFRPALAYRMDGSGAAKPSRRAGQNHTGGVPVYIYLAAAPDSATNISLSFHEADGDAIRTFSTQAKEKRDSISLKKGLNRFVWDMRYPDAKKFDGMILWWASLRGPKAVPGTYKVRLNVNGQVTEEAVEIRKDPRSGAELADMRAQFDFIRQVQDKLTETHQAIIDLRKARKQIQVLQERTDTSQTEIQEYAEAILKEVRAVEEALYQTKNRSGQDPLNFPIRLNNKLGHLASLCSMGNYGPTEQAEAFRREVTAEIDRELARLRMVFSEMVPTLNAKVKAAAIDAVKVQ